MARLNRGSLLSGCVLDGPTEGQAPGEVFNRIKNSLIVQANLACHYTPYPYSTFKHFDVAMAELKKIVSGKSFLSEKRPAWHKTELKTDPAQVWMSSKDTLVCVESPPSHPTDTHEAAGYYIFVITSNASKMKAIDGWFQRHAQARDSEYVERGTVFLLVKHGSNFDFVSAGRRIKSDLIPTNYSKEVVDQHQYIADNIASSSPNGKIVIYQGKPGTGKTFLVRNLISKLSNCNVILIQSNQVKEIGSPSFIPALMRQTSNNFPVIFIIEDADEILSRRKAENMSGISTLLNIGDGVLGTVFDTRVVCTTNTEIKEFDPAIMRPGRLLSLIDVGALSKTEAQTCGAAILESQKIKKNINFGSCATLAEIYAKVGTESRSLINTKKVK